MEGVRNEVDMDVEEEQPPKKTQLFISTRSI